MDQLNEKQASQSRSKPRNELRIGIHTRNGGQSVRSAVKAVSLKMGLPRRIYECCNEDKPTKETEMTIIKKIKSIPTETKAILARRRCERSALEYLRREIEATR